MEMPLTDRRPKVFLTTLLEMRYFSLALSFVEESAAAFGLDPAGALKLRLACEEIFSYLAGSGEQGKTITIESENGGYYVRVKFLFADCDFDPHAFNLTTKASPDSEKGLAEMGLLIASRSVDRLEMLHNSETGLGVSLVKDKTYPEITDNARIPVKPLSGFSVNPPDREALKLFVRQVAAYYPARLYPAYFCSPGKVVDMIEAGRHRVLVASDPEAGVAGGIMWRPVGSKMIALFGPYLFGQPGENGMAETLVQEALAAMAKADAVGVMDVFATPELPKDYFELLGSVDHYGTGGEKERLTCFFRQLEEDPGARVWAHGDLVPFLEKEYSRLYLPRKILTPTPEGEGRPAHSVYSPRFSHDQGLVVLRLVWDGTDAEKVLEEHVRVLSAEGFMNILFEMDLAYAWQAHLVPALVREGFEPSMVLPHAGAGDIVVFERTRGR